MGIVLTRVDDRLIHGQVAVGWTRTIGATHIVVANDEVSKDRTQIMLLKMATPVGVKSSILSVDEAAQKLANNEFKKDKVLLLVRDPKSLVRLIDGGVDLQEVNIGNVRAAEGRKRLIKEVAATEEEIGDWKELDRRNVSLQALWLPDGKATNFNKVLKEF